MWSPKAVLLFLLIPVFILNNQEANGCNKRAATQDSIVVAQSQGVLEINKSNSTAGIQLKSNQQQLFNKSKSYGLVLDGIQLRQLPEGVYEIYFAPTTSRAEELVAGSPYFIDLLDTYTLGSTEGPKRLYLDITDRLSDLNNNSNRLLDYSLTVLFRGNKNRDSTSAVDAGHLIINTVKLLQTNRK